MFFFLNDTATTEIYTLSLHDALPIWRLESFDFALGEADVYAIVELPDSAAAAALSLTITGGGVASVRTVVLLTPEEDRKSTRLNSSHANISYAVFCLKKKQHDSHTRR